MISNQILQSTIEGLKTITRIDICVLDTEGNSLAETTVEEYPAEEYTAVDIRVGSLKGPTSMGIVKLMKDAEDKYFSSDNKMVCTLMGFADVIRHHEDWLAEMEKASGANAD